MHEKLWPFLGLNKAQLRLFHCVYSNNEKKKKENILSTPTYPVLIRVYQPREHLATTATAIIIISLSIERKSIFYKPSGSHLKPKIMTADGNHEISLAEAMTNLLQDTTALDTPDAPSVDLAAEIDVKLWLQHTGFFDVEHRQKVLGALRQLKALDEQRQKIISDIHHATPYVVPPSTPVFSRSQSQSVYSPSLYSAQKPSPLALGRLRDYADLAGYHATGVQSAGELCGSEPSLVNKGADSESAYSTFGNGSLSSQQHDMPAPDSSVKHAQRTGDAVASLDGADLKNQDKQSPSKRPIVIEASDNDAWPVDEVAQPSTPTQGISTLMPKRLKATLVDKINRSSILLSQVFQLD